MKFSYDCSWKSGADKQHQAHSTLSDVDMNTREQSAAINKTVVGTFPISKEKALILSVIRSLVSLPLVLSISTCDRSITHVMGERFMAIETIWLLAGTVGNNKKSTLLGNVTCRYGWGFRVGAD